MPSKRHRWLLVASSALALTMLVWAGALASPPSDQSAPSIEIDMSVGLAEGAGAVAFTGASGERAGARDAGPADDAVVYRLTLKNTGSSEVGDIFLAGTVPPGMTPRDALNTPRGSWFRGFEGAGSSLHAAVWLVERIPAGESIGPFVYRVSKGRAVDLEARGWVHWVRPSEGSGLSASVNPLSGPVLGMAPGARYHNVHTAQLGLSCATCHTQKTDGYYDPLAQQFNPVDKQACLSCHSSGRVLYGDGWQGSTAGQ